MKQKKSTGMQSKKELKDAFIKDLTTWTGVTLLMALPESGNVKITMKEKGYKRRFVIRQSDEMLEVKLHGTGNVDLIYSNKTFGSFINPYFAYGQYLKNREMFRYVYARRMLCIFNSFLTGTLHGSIEEMISEQRMEEEAGDEEEAQDS